MNSYFLKHRPIVAAHRGLACSYPENTLEGFRAALDSGADFVELDVVLNLEAIPIVCHDAFLSNISDVALHPEFADRKIKRILNDEEKDDWWIMDFTLDELRTLRLRQAILKRSIELDWKFRIPTLEEVINDIKSYNTVNKLNKGILLEIKDDKLHKSYMDAQIGKYVMDLLIQMQLSSQAQCTLEVPIVLMAFDADILKYCKSLSDLPRMQLLWTGEKIPVQLKEISEYADLIGVELKMMWCQHTQQTNQFFAEAKSLGLHVYGWTFQDDNEEIHTLFQTDNPQHIYEKVHALAGIITEFPQVAIKYY